MVIVDTSIIIDHLRRPPEESNLIKLWENHPHQAFAVSIITIQELYAGKSTQDKLHETHLLSTLDRLEVVPYNLEIAKLAGEIIRDSNQIIDFADAAIAATTIINSAELATLNHKHFQGIPNLELLEKNSTP